MKLRGFTLIQMSVLLMVIGAVIVLTAKTASRYAGTSYQMNLHSLIDKNIVIRLNHYAKMYKTLPGSGTDLKILPSKFDETLKPVFDRNNIFYKSVFNDKAGEICSAAVGVTLYYCQTQRIDACSEKDAVQTISDLAYIIIHPGKDMRLSAFSPKNSDKVFILSGPGYFADGLFLADDDIVEYITMDEARVAAGCINEPPAVSETLPRIRKSRINEDYGNAGYYTKLPAAFGLNAQDNIRCCISADFPGKIESSCEIGVCDNPSSYKSADKNNLFLNITKTGISAANAGNYRFTLYLLTGAERTEQTTVKTMILNVEN
ncbi:MAG: hypothetical protein LBH05_03595 [Deferribacteraceae bacterium]|jgi:hypothetical protein|nr:hypothetical protein [Deferribacteraceae bacterium]